MFIKLSDDTNNKYMELKYKLSYSTDHSLNKSRQTLGIPKFHVPVHRTHCEYEDRH